MSIRFEMLNRESWENLHNLALATYLDGQCYEFAIALHIGLGWQLFGLMNDNVIRHALVRSPNHGGFRDIRGVVSERKIGLPFGMNYPYILKKISVRDLRNVRPIDDHLVERASLVAESLWPVLPWKPGCFQRRTIAFLRELEKLCNKHRIWIRSPFPAVPIILDESSGDEAGFRILPTLDSQYSFDRYLK